MDGWTDEMVLSRGEGQVSEAVDGETVLLDVEGGKYYALDPVGTAVWEHLATSLSLGELLDRLTVDFDVARSTCREDLTAFLGELVERGLIRCSSPGGGRTA